MSKPLMIALALSSFGLLVEQRVVHPFGCFDGWPAPSGGGFAGKDVLNKNAVPLAKVLDYARDLQLDAMLGAPAFTLNGDVRSHVKPEPGMCELTQDELARSTGGRLVAGVTTDAQVPGAGIKDRFTVVWIDFENGDWRLVMIGVDADTRIEVPVKYVAGTGGWPTACSGQTTPACWESAPHPDGGGRTFDRLVVAGVQGGYLRAERPLDQ